MYINKIVFSDGSEKEFSDAGTRAMKETTAYMMTEMMKTVLAYGTGRGAYLPWLPQAGKTGTSNYLMKRLKTILKQVNLLLRMKCLLVIPVNIQWQSGPVTQTALLQ